MDRNSTVTLGRGNRMPVLGIRTWQVTKSTGAVVAAALENGHSIIDTSGDYGTQPGFRYSALGTLPYQ